MSWFATAAVSFFQNLTKQLSFIRSQGLNEGAQSPGRRITVGAPNHYGERRMTAGTPKSPNNVTDVFFNAVYLLPKDLKFEHGGAKLASIARALSNLVMPLYARVMSCTCFNVWVFSPHWRSLLRMWLSKLLHLSSRSAASISWEKLLYTSKTISKTSPNSYGCFHSKAHQEALIRQCFSQ